jgi:Protein of unknown function (DUF1549)/Protein of unknown function (DUF1553)/Planctomycete cytochrome C
MRRTLSLLSGLLILTAVVKVLTLRAADPAASPEFFETKIRPVLAQNCYTCHTNEASGGLRLDTAEALFKGGDHGAPIVPGDPDKSLLITAVRQTNANLKMPEGGKLTDTEISDLEAWVKAGAVWPKETPAAAAVAAKVSPKKYVIADAQRQLWSLLPLKSPAAPEVKDQRWTKTPIDKFVFAKMQQEGLAPVAPASKRDLIRRATLDLTGLPPTIEEIDAFEKDTSADAFPKVVDRLLASPHYGERWGRVWLDVARYGEDDYRSLNSNPKGYRPYPNAYAYRDWVIQAMNDDMPYDTFIKAQLAGDLMDPKVRYKMLPATGFLGLGPWYYDNGSNEVTRADERHDRVDVITRGFLGLTVACARCHDHKYDPIPQTDYYSLAGVFFNTIYEEYPTAPKSIVDAYEKIQTELDEKNKLLQETNTSLTAELVRSYAVRTSEYLQGVWDVSPAGKKDLGTVAESRKLDYEVLDRWTKYMAKKTTKYHNKDAWQAMIKSKNGGTAAEAKRLADKFQEELTDAMVLKADLDAQNQIIKDKDVEGTKPKKRTDKPSNFVSNRDFNPGSQLRLLGLPEEENNFWTEVFQREVKDAEDPNAMDAAAGGGRNAGGGVLTFRGYGLQSRIGPEEQARTKALQDDIDALRKKLEADKYPFVHGVKDSEAPVNIQVALRGNPMNLGDEVPRHFLSILSDGDPQPFKQGSGRLELAEDIVRQPLAMRVIVNRIWKEHFDTGIVDTPSNFGQKGERPTNPDLIEYLANDFVKNGMSIKKLQREIMLTQVYQLSTQNNDADFAKDSGDRFYWRANHHRLDAEELRDSVLSAAGNLDITEYGPSEELTPANLRRTVYGKVSRYKLDTYLSTFDFPTPNISAEKRFVTTVPLQRLFLMNSDFMQIESEELWKRVSEEPDNTARIKKVYQLAFGRLPSEGEIKIGLDYLHAEPMREYDENKNKPPEADSGGGGGRGRGGKGGGGGGKGGGGKGGGGKGGGAVTQVDAPADGAAGAAEVADADLGNGMMGGVGGGGGGGGFAGGGGKGGGGKAGGGGGRGGGGAAAPAVKYDASAGGRYVKTLLSSSEFLFVN